MSFLSPTDDGLEKRATFLELFFDLVFVFAVTQIALLLAHDLTWEYAGKALLLFLVVWWAWIYTTWMVNAFSQDVIAVRAVLLLSMLAAFGMALAIPDAFGDRALLFAGSYVALQTGRNAFTVYATRNEDTRLNFLRPFVFNALVGVLWIAGAFLSGDGRIAVWLAALALDYAGPFVMYWTPGLGRGATTDWSLNQEHFIERFQLFIIIVLGESIVVTGAATSGLELNTERVLAAMVAFGSTVALWWLYFDHVSEHAKEDFTESTDPVAIGRDAYTFLHIPIVAGIVVMAVANEFLISHPGATPTTAQLIALAGGPSLYLLGHVAFRLRLTMTVDWLRLGAVVVVCAIGVLGVVLTHLIAGALILGVLASVAIYETGPHREHHH